MDIKNLIQLTQDNVRKQQDLINRCVEDIVNLYHNHDLENEELEVLLHILNASASNHLNQAFMQQQFKNSKNN